jgi:uncharacterized protein (DUF1015 family)
VFGCRLAPTEMDLIRPFAALRPAPGRAAEVAAPPYDVLTTVEARARAAGKPWSFLHISKPQIDLPEGTDPYAPQVYATAAQNLARMLERGILRRDPEPCYYAYRLRLGDHSQIGLIATASIAEYESNRIRCHELTRPDKEDDRVRQIDALNAQTGPVMLAYPPASQVDAILDQTCGGPPDTELTADDGVYHAIWVIRDSATILRLTRAFNAMPALYIADGHHRSAAAARVAASRRGANPQQGGSASYDYFLAVIFPHHQMQILDYNRVVTDLNGLTEGAFLKRLAEHFEVSRSPGAVKPERPGELGLYLPGNWYRLTLRPGLTSVADPVARLEVSLLSDYLLRPVLGIHDLRRDHRIDFVGGARGLTELEKRVNTGKMAAAFSLFPTRMEDLMAVADLGKVMPPKSTWFEPKLADGLASHVLD